MSTSAIEKAMNTPPIVVAGATIFGYSLPEIASFVTIIYTLILIWLRLRREWRDWRAKHPRRTSAAESRTTTDAGDDDAL